MSGHNPQRNAAPAKQFRQPHADGLQSHEIDFIGVEPTRVIFAKARRLDEGKPLKVGRVRLQIGTRNWKHRHGLWFVLIAELARTNNR